ncbi:MAG: hypothetical protein WC496_06865 [Phycisphaerae bacterium]|jgi:hypothetical protein
MIRRTFLFSLFLLAAITVQSYAVNIYWTGFGADPNWNTGDNWDAYEPPYPGDLAVIDLPDIDGSEPNCTVDATVDVSIGSLWMGFSQRPCYLDMTGGHLTTTNAGEGFRIGIDNGTGILRMSGGEITVNGDMSVGQGANAVGNVEIADGNITVTGTAYLYVGFGGGTGRIDISGGTLSVFYLQMDADGSQVVNLTGDGQLIIRDPRPVDIGYQVLSFYAAPERNWITSYDGAGTLDVAVGPNSETIVTAVPPACWPAPIADLTGDCIVNFDDFAVMAGEWLDCNRTDGSCPE